MEERYFQGWWGGRGSGLGKAFRETECIKAVGKELPDHVMALLVYRFVLRDDSNLMESPHTIHLRPRVTKANVFRHSSGNTIPRATLPFVALRWLKI